MPASFTSKFNFGYGWFLGEDPGTEPLDFQTKASDALILDAFGQDISNTAGLTYGYRGGWLYDATSKLPIQIAAGTIAVPANQVTYIQRSAAGVVSIESSFTIDNVPMAVVTTNNFEIVNIVDARTVNGSFPNLVTSVFGRTGAVAALMGDYTANKITLFRTLLDYPSALDVQQALELMDTNIALALMQGVKSFGPIGGLARTGNVFTQYGDYTADTVGIVNVIPNLDLSAFVNPSVQNALGLISMKSGVSSFNTRVGNVMPLSTDYPAGFIPYINSAPMVPLLPSGATIGTNVQSAFDGFKQHFHDATQITMNPVIVTGKDTVQKMLQWLYDNRGVVTGGLTITTSDYSFAGTAPFDIDIVLSATGGVAPYTWTYVSGTIPGDPANGSALATGHLTITGITPAGTYYATIEVTDSTPGTPLTATGTMAVNLMVVSAPTITSFTSSPTSGHTGDAFLLSWSTIGATSLSIDHGVGAVTGTSHTVSPTVTTTYTLTATNSHGSVTATTMVTIIVDAPPAPPVINSFTSSPDPITYGSSATLSWSVSGATSLSINQGVGVVTGTSTSVNPFVTTTYTLTAVNAGGSVTATVTVTVIRYGSATYTGSTFNTDGSWLILPRSTVYVDIRLTNHRTGETLTKHVMNNYLGDNRAFNDSFDNSDFTMGYLYTDSVTFELVGYSSTLTRVLTAGVATITGSGDLNMNNNFYPV